MPLTSGQLLNNRYRIVDPIGQGGFGAVYRAWDTVLDKEWAAKENLDTSPAAQRQFEREAIILAKLRHPNLPQVTDHFLVPGQGQYLVMDFISGDSLAAKMDQRQGWPLEQEQALAWIDQICDALIYLHSRSHPVIHRDIKPENIIITPDSQAMLVDFGISKLFDPDLKTTIGARAVTPGYSPPEQYGDGHTDARTDIYALGATLNYLLTGRELPESVLRLNSDRTVARPRHFNAEISPEIERVIIRATEIDFQRRYQQVRDLRQALHMGTTSYNPPAETEPIKRPAPVTTRPSLSKSLNSQEWPEMPALSPHLKRYWPVILLLVASFACCGLSLMLSQLDTDSEAIIDAPNTVRPAVRAFLPPTYTAAASGVFDQLGNAPWVTPRPLPTFTLYAPPPRTNILPSPTSMPLPQIVTQPPVGQRGVDSSRGLMVVNNWQVRVERIELADRLTGISGNVEKAAGRFALIFLTVTNIGLSTDTFVAFGDLEVEDAAGQRFDENFLASAYAEYQYGTDLGASINPDESARVVAVYDISYGSAYYLLVPGTLARSSQGNITLNIP